MVAAAASASDRLCAQAATGKFAARACGRMMWSKKMKIHRINQGTPEWKKLRLGVATASWFHTIITPLGKPTDNRERKKYIYRLVAERLLQQPMPDSYVNAWMERGNDLEDAAARAFVKQQRIPGEDFDAGGFVTTDDGKLGCSPDRIIYRGKKTEGVEIKVPSPWVHLANLCGEPDPKYKAQVQGQMLIAEFEAVHFWSWNPNLPEVHKLTLRDDKFTRQLEILLGLFIEEVDQTEDFVRRKGDVRVLAEPPLNGHFPWGDP